MLLNGQWRIVEMEIWDQEYIDMEVPGHFTFHKNASGHFQFGLVQGEMDCRMETVGEKARVACSWEGQDEIDPANGRGLAVVIENGDEDNIRCGCKSRGRSHRRLFRLDRNK